MSDAAQREPLTRYLQFKVALGTGDRKLAMECLSSLCNPEVDTKFLYSCAIEAQRQGDQECTVECLMKLASAYDQPAPNPLHLPAVLRCTIRLIHNRLESEDGGIDQFAAVERLCSVFDCGTIAPPPFPPQSPCHGLISYFVLLFVGCFFCLFLWCFWLLLFFLLAVVC